MLAIFCAGCAGCSYTFDSSQPFVPLSGTAPSPDGLQQLSYTADQELSIATDAEGAPWAIIYQFVDEVGIAGPLHVARLKDPVIDFMYPAALQTEIGHQKIYFIERESDGDHIEIRSPGEPRSGAQIITTSVVGGAFQTSPHDDAFCVVADDDPRQVILARSDGSSLFRTSANFGQAGFPVFSDDDEFFFDYALDGAIIAHPTRGGTPLSVGIWLPPQQNSTPTETISDWGQGHALITCDVRGVTAWSYPGGGATVLDVAPCRAPSDNGGAPLPAIQNSRYVYFAGNQVRSAPLDGSTPPSVLRTLAEGQQVVTWTPSLVAYSNTPPGAFEEDAGDGWVAGWKFMERGIRARFSFDGTRVRWLEHAADDEAVGELRAAPLGENYARLAANVLEFDQLPDGRVLAASNHAFDGAQNRIIVIDEKANQARDVAEGAVSYSLIPGSTDVLVHLYSDSGEQRLARYPVPPRGAQ